MESQSFEDVVRYVQGFRPSAALADTDIVGDAMREALNCALDENGRPVGWRGVSRVHQPAGKLYQQVGNKIATIGTGNVALNNNNTIWFVGSGPVHVEDATTPIGTASSQLQVKVGNQVYQAGLPAPPAPVVEVATDASGANIVGTLNGTVVFTVSRLRTATGSAIAPGESPESPTSVSLEVRNGRARVHFERALTDSGQDGWGLYATKPLLSGTGRRQLLRYVYESELSDPVSASLGTAAGDSSTTTFSATTATNISARTVAIAVASSGGSPPTSRGTNTFALTGVGVTVPLITGMLPGEFQLVALQIKQVHQVQNHEMNHGALTPTLTGAVTYLGGILNDTTTIQLEIVSGTQFRWKREPDAGWTTQNLTTTPSALGATGLFVKWNAATANVSEQTNKYFVTPFGVSVPTGWTAHKHQASADDAFVNVVYGKIIASGEESFTWAMGASVQVNMHTIGLTGNHATPVVATAGGASTNATTHSVVFAGAPAASSLVCVFFGSETPVAFTLSAPLAANGQSNLSTRFVDVEFTNDDLLDIFPPKAEEVDAPPAATHVCPLGQIMVLLGTFDGAGVTPSLPGRFDLYSIARTTFLTPREAVLRVDVRPQDGMVFIWTRSSVQTLVETGDDRQPVIPRGLISNRGIANQNAAVVTDAGAYAFDADEGLYFVSNYRELRTDFLAPVRDALRELRADEVVLAYDIQRRALHVGDRRRMLVFYEQEGGWSSFLSLDAFLHFQTSELPDVRITSAITFDGKLFLSVGNDTLGYQAYQVNRGIGTDWYARSAPRYAGYQRYEKTLHQARLFANFDSSHELDWHTGVNAVASMGQLRGTGADGSIISDVVIAEHQFARGVAWEFTIGDGRENSGYLWANFADLPTNLTSDIALLSVIFSPTSLTVKKEGSAQAFAPTVEAGDVLRIEYSGTWAVTLWRAGTMLATQNLGAPGGAVTSLGVKAFLVNSDARLDFGRIQKSAPSGGFRIFREFEPTAVRSRQYGARGDAYYRWEKLNLRRAVSYRAEVFGDAAGQRPHNLLIQSTIIPIEKTS